METSGRDGFAVGSDGESANAAEIDLLTAVVRVQGLGVECAGKGAGGDVPLADRPQQVAAQERFPVRMEFQRVNVTFVSLQLPDERSTRDVPELDHTIVAAAGQQAPIRTDAQGTHPSLMGFLLPNRLGRWRSRSGIPDGDPPVSAAAEGAFSIGGKRE